MLTPIYPFLYRPSHPSFSLSFRDINDLNRSKFASVKPSVKEKNPIGIALLNLRTNRSKFASVKKYSLKFMEFNVNISLTAADLLLLNLLLRIKTL